MNLGTSYLRFRYPRHTFGPGFRGPVGLRIRGKGRVRFGHDVHIVNASGRTVFLTYGPQARIDIGDRVEIDGAGFMATTEIVVEEDAVLGPCLVLDTDFHAIGPERRHHGARVEQRPIRISRRAWVQARASILKGVRIGESAVVRYGAVVAADVPPRAIVIGNPAQVVGSV